MKLALPLAPLAPLSKRTSKFSHILFLLLRVETTKKEATSPPYAIISCHQSLPSPRVINLPRCPTTPTKKKNKICSHCSYTSRIHDLLISPAAILHPICPYAHSYVLTLASPPPLHTNDEHKTLIIFKPKRFILFYLITV